MRSRALSCQVHQRVKKPARPLHRTGVGALVSARQHRPAAAAGARRLRRPHSRRASSYKTQGGGAKAQAQSHSRAVDWKRCVTNERAPRAHANATERSTVWRGGSPGQRSSPSYTLSIIARKPATSRGTLLRGSRLALLAVQHILRARSLDIQAAALLGSLVNQLCALVSVCACELARRALGSAGCSRAAARSRTVDDANQVPPVVLPVQVALADESQRIRGRRVAGGARERA